MPIVQHLLVETFGSHIGKYSQRLKVTQKGTTLAQAPLLHLETVTILNRGVSISADALEACTERGIPIFFINGHGAPYASIYAAGLAGTVITRREQLRAYDDSRGLALGLAFAYGKIQNQSITLRYLSRSRKDTPEGNALHMSAADVLDHFALLDRVEGETVDDIRMEILGIEGRASRVYWEAVRGIIPEIYGWERREGRGATDAVNALLNYGYGILYGQIERALVLAGLDPFAGYVHVDRPGKPSLVLDIIEEFRQTCIDRVVFGLVNRQFNVEMDDKGLLTEETRLTFADHVLKHLETGMRYQGKRHPMRQIIQMQAREMSAFLRGERDAYIPFKAEG